MENETNETWRDRKRRELMEKQMEMAYEVARISIEIKKLREEPPVPEGSVPLSMIEPLINETVERLMLLKDMKKPKPKRVTRAAIIDAIGCPNLVLERVKHRDVLVGEHTVGFAFSYLKEGVYGDYEVLGQLEVNHPRLKDLTLEQWVDHGQKLVDEVKLRRDLSSAIEAVSPSKTPFMTEGRDVNLNEWET